MSRSRYNDIESWPDASHAAVRAAAVSGSSRIFLSTGLMPVGRRLRLTPALLPLVMAQVFRFNGAVKARREGVSSLSAFGISDRAERGNRATSSRWHEHDFSQLGAIEMSRLRTLAS
jgi:hypothetical protein